MNAHPDLDRLVPVVTPDRWLRDFAALEFKPEVRPLILKDNTARVLGLAG